jgi:hypothetical protein
MLLFNYKYHFFLSNNQVANILRINKYTKNRIIYLHDITYNVNYVHDNYQYRIKYIVNSTFLY